MTDQLTPAQIADIDRIAGPIHRERAAAPGLAARYDDACIRIAEMHDETVAQRRRIEDAEEQRDGLLVVLQEVRRVLNKWDRPYATGHASNCIHAVAELQRLLEPTTKEN